MKIGLTQRVLVHKGRAYDSIEHGWYRYLKGHTLCTIPNIQDQDFTALAQELDLLIITGGDDSALRRVVEIRMSTEMSKLGKPILGVCHGCFLLAELLGSEIEDIEGHLDTKHPVNYQAGIVLVNSYHNIAIKRLHNSGVILVTDMHGNCEAWRDGHIAGVVWHPERMTDPWLPEEIENLIRIK